jgi:ubiquinone/menaquinone biosynthesis C-methylase UbiE
LHLPFATESFDVLLDRGCFRHVPPAARGAYVTELRRVLRPSGQLLLFRTPDDQALDPTELQHSFTQWQVVPLDPEAGYALSPNRLS